MKLVPINELLKDAKANRYAVGAFNVVNLEMLQAIDQAAQEEKTPVIVQVWHGDLDHAGGSYISAIAHVAAEASSVPIALQLDHGQNLSQVRSCIEWGFSSVMIDLSLSNFKENIINTKQIVREAHSKGVSVEAELGKIFSGKVSVDKQRSAMTDPGNALKFTNETGVDALAVSIGTAHGSYSRGPIIDFDLLDKIINMIDTPIVVHGGSGTSPSDLRKMIKLGVTKINFGTELMQAYIEGLRKGLSNDDSSITVRGIMGYVRDCVKRVVVEKIRILNSIRTDKR